MTSPRRPALAIVSLVAASLLFGGTFVVVKSALDDLPPHAFLAWRFLLAFVLLACLARPRGRQLWRDGIVAGLFLHVGYVLQTVGLTTTSASHSGLITGLYVVITPLLVASVSRRSVRWGVLVGAALALVGLALLAGPSTGPLNRAVVRGDLLTVGCAVAFAGHIVVLSRTARRHPAIPFTAVQVLVVALLSIGLSGVLEGLPVPGRSVWLALALTGIAATAGAFLLQVWAQGVVGASRTAVVLSLEPLFAALFGAALLGERLTRLGWLGGLLILGGIQVVLRFTRDEDVLIAEATTEAH